MQTGSFSDEKPLGSNGLEKIGLFQINDSPLCQLKAQELQEEEKYLNQIQQSLKIEALEENNDIEENDFGQSNEDDFNDISEEEFSYSNDCQEFTFEDYDSKQEWQQIPEEKYCILPQQDYHQKETQNKKVPQVKKNRSLRTKKIKNNVPKSIYPQYQEKTEQFFPQFQEPTYQEICKGIQALKNALPYCSIEKVVIGLHRLLIPNNAQKDPYENRRFLNKSNMHQRINQILAQKNFDPNFPLNNAQQNIKFAETSRQSIKPIKKRSDPKQNFPKVSQNSILNVGNQQITQKSQQPWMDKNSPLSNEDQFFKFQRKVAKVFILIGPTTQAASRYLGCQIQAKRSYNYFRNVARSAFRQLQKHMKDELKMGISVLSKDQFTYIATPLVHCREWMSSVVLNTFFTFIKIVYRLKLTKMPTQEQIIELHEKIMNALQQRLIKSSLKKGFNPDDVQKIKGFFSSKSTKVIKCSQMQKKQVIQPLQIEDKNAVYFGDEDQSSKSIQKEELKLEVVNTASYNQKTPSSFRTQPLSNSRIIGNSFWTQRLQHQFAQIYISKKKINQSRDQFANRYPQLDYDLSSREAKSKMQKLCRLGIKKMHAMYSQCKVTMNLPEMPVFNDVAIKMFLRNPQGVDLRVAFLQFFMQREPNFNLLRQAIDCINEFLEMHNLYISREMEKPYNLPKSRRKQLYLNHNYY